MPARQRRHGGSGQRARGAQKDVAQVLDEAAAQFDGGVEAGGGFGRRVGPAGGGATASSSMSAAGSALQAPGHAHDAVSGRLASPSGRAPSGPRYRHVSRPT